MSEKDEKAAQEPVLPQKVEQAATPIHLDRISIRQIQAMKANRRKGMGIQAISQLMGVSEATVSRHTRDISPVPATESPGPNDGQSVEKLPSVSENNGPFFRGPPVNPVSFGAGLLQTSTMQYLLLMAGDAVRLGYSNLDKYFEDTIGWLSTITEVRKLVGIKDPDEFMNALKVLITKANQFDKMVTNARNIGDELIGRSH